MDEERIEEKELWGKLNELNKEFATINNIKKKQKNVLLLYVIDIIYSLLF